MKQFKKQLLSLGLLPIGVIPILVVSCSASENKGTYFEKDGLKISFEGEIMGIDNSYIKDGTLKIEEEYSGVKIKYIADNAFEDNKLITKLSLPKSLVRIGEFAFINNNISSIDFTELDNLEEISVSAFESNQITSLKLPNSITTIGSYAFSDNQITSLTLPNSITTIGKKAFRNNQLASLTLSNKLTKIEESAFAFNKLTSLIIPDSVTSIEVYAFWDNPLSYLVVPDSVMEIGDMVFSNSDFTSISQMILPPKFNTYEERARIGIGYLTQKANWQN
ncbi:MAG: leucine-rich repeat protein [Metamycoplasmataceae bacterium]